MRERIAKTIICCAAVLTAVTLVLLTCNLAKAQCTGGSCRVYNGWRPGPQVDVKVKVKRPTPAWRYERPVGYRTSVVRVYCQDGVRTRSIGSGVLVRWGKRIVVLTARHVVKDAKSVIVETFKRKSYRARIIKVDAAWDCAVLELSGKPEGVTPAEVELGPAAMFRDGDRLESCGYGPDGKLACNTGLFKGYRRSTAKQNGPDDWMVVSGHARGGDSGGPVFNKRGRLVGVLWGTDGETVVCVQAGRIHVLLDDAMRTYRQQATTVGIFQRNPTPPKHGPLVPVPQPAIDVCVGERDSLLPWRKDAETRDRDFELRLNGLLTAQEQERQARLAGPSVDVRVGPQRDVEPETANRPAPIGVAMCLLGAVVVGAIVFYGVQKN